MSRLNAVKRYDRNETRLKGKEPGAHMCVRVGKLSIKTFRVSVTGFGLGKVWGNSCMRAMQHTAERVKFPS